MFALGSRVFVRLRDHSVAGAPEHDANAAVLTRVRTEHRRANSAVDPVAPDDQIERTRASSVRETQRRDRRFSVWVHSCVHADHLELRAEHQRFHRHRLPQRAQQIAPHHRTAQRVPVGWRDEPGSRRVVAVDQIWYVYVHELELSERIVTDAPRAHDTHGVVVFAEHLQATQLIEHRGAAVEVERRAERGLDLGELVVHRDVVEAVVPKRERGGQAARARAHDRDAQRRGTRAIGIGIGIVRPSGTSRRDGRPVTERARSARTPVGTSSRKAEPDRTRRGHRAEPGVKRVPGADAASGRGARRRNEIRRGGHRARRSGVWGGGERRASVSAFGKVGMTWPNA